MPFVPDQVQETQDGRFVPDANAVRFPPPEKSWLDKANGAANTLHEAVGAISEPVARFGSSIVAHPTGLVAGAVKGGLDAIRQGVFGNGQQGMNAQEMQDYVTNGMTYQPRTSAGASPYNPLNAVPNAIGAGMNAIIPKSPEEARVSPTSLEGAARIGVREGVPQLLGALGAKYIPPAVKSAAAATGKALKGGARATMVNAIKATPQEVASGEAAAAADQLLKRRLDPNVNGVVTMTQQGKDLGAQVAQQLEGSTASTPVAPIVNSLQNVATRFQDRPGLPQNMAAIEGVGNEFANRPGVGDSGGRIPILKAQSLKQGYLWGARDAYGKESTAAIEAQKQIAQALRKGIEAKHPEVGPLNAEQSAIIKALDVIERRAAMEQNAPLVGHPTTLGGIGTQAAMAINRNPWIRSNIAHGMNRLGNLLAPERPVAPAGRRIVGINKDIPYNGLPQIPGSNVIPGSWREGLDRGAGSGPLPAMAEDLLPHGAGGALRTPGATGPLPTLPPIDPNGLPPVLNTPAIPPVTELPSISMPQLLRRSLPVPEVELQKLGIKADNVVDAQNIIQTRIRKVKTEYEQWAEDAAKRFRAEQAKRLNERSNNPPVLSGAERRAAKQMRGANQREMDLAQRTRQAEMQAQVDELEALSERLSAPRPGSSPYLGPGQKTRTAQQDLAAQLRK